MGSLSDRDASTIWEAWETKKAREQRRAAEAKIEDDLQRQRIYQLALAEVDSDSTKRAAAQKPAGGGGGGGSTGTGSGSGGSGSGGSGGSGGGPVLPIVTNSKEEARAALAAADASVTASSPMAAIAENRVLPADVFIPKKYDLYNHLGVLTVPILPAVQEFLPSHRTTASRLARCFNRSLSPNDSAAGCHAAALSFWSRLKQPDVFPRELFTESEGETKKEPEPEPKTEAEWTNAFNKMKGDDRQASILFRLGCSKGKRQPAPEPSIKRLTCGDVLW